MRAASNGSGAASHSAAKSMLAHAPPLVPSASICCGRHFKEAVLCQVSGQLCATCCMLPVLSSCVPRRSIHACRGPATTSSRRCPPQTGIASHASANSNPTARELAASASGAGSLDKRCGAPRCSERSPKLIKRLVAHILLCSNVSNNRPLERRYCHTTGEALAMVALPAKGKLKGVLYDIDGTLVNSDPLHYLA